MYKFSIWIMLLFNNPSNSLNNQIIDNNKLILDLIEKNIQLERRIELIDIVEDNTLEKNKKIDIMKREINENKLKIIKINKIQDLKKKWFYEDSLKNSEKQIFINKDTLNLK